MVCGACRCVIDGRVGAPRRAPDSLLLGPPIRRPSRGRCGSGCLSSPPGAPLGYLGAAAQTRRWASGTPGAERQVGRGHRRARRAERACACAAAHPGHHAAAVFRPGCALAWAYEVAQRENHLGRMDERERAHLTRFETPRRVQVSAAAARAIRAPSCRAATSARCVAPRATRAASRTQGILGIMRGTVGSRWSLYKLRSCHFQKLGVRLMRLRT